jgi:hypothetical protein
MSLGNKYFMIPFANVPETPDYTVWFASWSTVRPVLEPGMLPPCVVGVTTDQLPAGAVLLESGGGKDPPPPPPPPAAVSMEEYKASIKDWLLSDRGA